jgi:predicted GNAT family acetyltransferase
MRSDEIEDILRDGRRLKAKVKLDMHRIVATMRLYYLLSGRHCAWLEGKWRPVTALDLQDPPKELSEYDPDKEAVVLWSPDGKDRIVVSRVGLPESLRGAGVMRCVAYAFGWR